MMDFKTLDQAELFRHYEDEARMRTRAGEYVAFDLPILSALTLHAVIRQAVMAGAHPFEMRRELAAIVEALEEILNRTPAIAETHRRGRLLRNSEVSRVLRP
jgi:hypothetical protein